MLLVYILGMCRIMGVVTSPGSCTSTRLLLLLALAPVMGAPCSSCGRPRRHWCGGWP